MPDYIIIETDAGMTIAENDPQLAPEKVALAKGGVLVDEQIYKTFDDAYDAMLNLTPDQDEELAG